MVEEGLGQITHMASGSHKGCGLCYLVCISLVPYQFNKQVSISQWVHLIKKVKIRIYYKMHKFSCLWGYVRAR